jgi:glutathione peroxidase
MNYGVNFPMMAKVEVNGGGAHPLWQWLKGEKPGFLGTEMIKWNFTKFLVGRDGQVLKRYAPQDEPEKLAKDIEAALAA